MSRIFTTIMKDQSQDEILARVAAAIPLDKWIDALVHSCKDAGMMKIETFFFVRGKVYDMFHFHMNFRDYHDYFNYVFGG